MYTEALPASCLSRRAALAGASVRAVIPVLSSPPAPAPLRPVPGAPASLPQQLQQQMQQQMHEVGSMSVDSETRSYKNLQPLRISSPSMPLPVDPGLRHGHLPCGLAYYIKKNRKPEQRLALRLAVRVGSINEEENQRGVAHIIEHLAFRATRNFENFQLIDFFESIGAAFGACQNAYTSFDETVYILNVPTDRPGLLRKAIHVIHEWSTRIRLSQEDVDGERGIVLEEWRPRAPQYQSPNAATLRRRAGRTSAGRMAESYWRTITKGSLYERRMPIGTEDVIRHVGAPTVRAFYDKWYKLPRMAAIIVGDIKSTEEVYQMLLSEFSSEPVLDSGSEAAQMARSPPLTVPPHSETRFSTFVDAEATSCEVLIECKQPRVEQPSTVSTLRRYIHTNLFADALNQRLYAISKREDAPFFEAQAGNSLPCRSLESYTLTASAPQGGLLPALKCLLSEVERARRHGFSERELAIVRANYTTELKTTFLERHQVDSSELASECCSHFLSGELVLGVEMEVSASKALLASCTTAELQAEASNWEWKSSCVIKVVLPKPRCASRAASAVPSEAALRAVLDEVLAEAPSLSAWQSVVTRRDLAELVGAPPPPGSIVSRETHEAAGIEAITLSNGFSLLLKQTQLQDDELLIAGFARGGLSELPRSHYFSAALSDLIANESGAFGCPPPELVELLAGKSVSISTESQLYSRRFRAECSPHDLETCLQLLHLLFTHRSAASRESHTRNVAAALSPAGFHLTKPQKRQPSRAAAQQITQLLVEGVLNHVRDPHARWEEAVASVNTCGHSYFRKPRMLDIRQIDLSVACAHFDASFAAPGEFTMVVVGAYAIEQVLPLLEKWLASVPAPAANTARMPKELKPLHVQFPSGVVKRKIALPMVEPSSSTQITWPLVFEAEQHEFMQLHRLSMLCKVLERRLLRRLRFQESMVYAVSVGIDFSTYASPDPRVLPRGTLNVTLSCEPKRAAEMAGYALDEVLSLRNTGPSDEDVGATREMCAREHEEAVQSNSFWLERIRHAAYSARVPGRVEDKLLEWERLRQQALEELSISSVRQTLRDRLCDASNNYTVITLQPLPLAGACGNMIAAIEEATLRCVAPTLINGRFQ